jgi:hypothetical protein
MGTHNDRFQSLSQDHDLGRLPMISSDSFTYDLDRHPLPPPAVKTPVSAIRFTYDLDRHPLPPPAVKTPVSAIRLTPKIRSHVPKVLVSKAKPSSRPLVTTTSTSQPITRKTPSCVPLQVGIGNLSLRLGQASSPVRLCWYWLVGV